MPEIIKIITLNNEIEANLIEKLLNERNIPFNLKSYHDPAYNGIFQLQKGWGYIESSEEYRNEIIEIYENLKKYDNETNSIKNISNSISQNETKKVINTILMIIALIIILPLGFFFIRDYIYLKKNKKELSSSSNFNYSWDDKEKKLISKWKSNDKLAAIYFDENMNKAHEHTIGYNINGIKINETFDKNENGISEKIVSYNLEGKKIGKFYDKNENGIFEKSISYNLKGIKIEENYDKNEDGKIEKYIVFYNSGDEVIWKDENYDGYFEKCIISYRNGKEKEINIIDSVFKIDNKSNE
ncbi:MAG: hypothetical protein KAT05_12740 [Spirochaetes bacterium]|nr:hypothetical protein [Spirochaetota bacterium]